MRGRGGRRDEGRGGGMRGGGMRGGGMREGWERDEGISVLCGNIFSSSRQQLLKIWRKKGT